MVSVAGWNFVVRFLTPLYTSLVEFLIAFSSIFWHCSLIYFSVSFLIIRCILAFCCLYLVSSTAFLMPFVLSFFRSWTSLIVSSVIHLLILVLFLLMDSSAHFRNMFYPSFHSSFGVFSSSHCKRVSKLFETFMV